LPSGPLPVLFALSRRFEQAAHKAYDWSIIRTGRSLSQYLRTTSPYQRLEPFRREQLLRALERAVDGLGGHFRQRWETHLHIARKAG
jgi:hypothetical protein